MIADEKISPARLAADVPRRFLRWWGRELRFLLAYPPLSLLFGGEDRVIVDLGRGRVSITKCHSGEDTRLGSFAMAGGLPPDALAVMRGKVRRGTEAVIRLPREQILCRDLALPLEAESNLREVLGFEMDRHTPYRADQVYYDHSVLERQQEERKLRVQMLVAPQAPLAPMVRSLHGLGLVPSMITVGDEGTGQCEVATINLLPETSRERTGRSWVRIHRGLLIVMLVMLGAVIVVPLQRQQALIDELEARTEALRPTVASTQTMRQTIGDMREELDLFVEQKRQSPVVLNIVEEVSRLLPDDTWLVRFELKDRRLHLQGIAAEAPALIGLLEASPVFTGVTFSSPVVRDPRYNRFQFNIEAGVVGGRGG